MDPAKTAVTEDVEIVRDRAHITLVDGSIQIVKPVNGVVFGAVFIAGKPDKVTSDEYEDFLGSIKQ